MKYNIVWGLKEKLIPFPVKPDALKLLKLFLLLRIILNIFQVKIQKESNFDKTSCDTVQPYIIFFQKTIV